ncbi:MAG: flavodoxin family protein [Bacillota bacterium]
MIILNGSPNAKSHSMNLLKHHFDIEGARIFNAYAMDVSPCDDCKLCMRKPRCKFNDAMEAFKDALEAHETLCIVSPIHFGTFSVPTLTVLSRLQELFNRKHTLKAPIPTLKTLHIVATAGADDRTMFEGIKKTHAILKSLLSAREGRIFTQSSTDKLP